LWIASLAVTADQILWYPLTERDAREMAAELRMDWRPHGSGRAFWRNFVDGRTHAGRAWEDLGRLRWSQRPPLPPGPAPGQHLGTIRINSDGFRGREIVRPRPPDVLRVVVIGNSVTFGVGAGGDSATLPARLEERLAALLKRPVEVVDLSLPRATAADVRVIWFEVGQHLDPQVVVAFVGVQDLGDAVCPPRKSGDRLPTLLARSARWSGLAWFLWGSPFALVEVQAPHPAFLAFDDLNCKPAEVSGHDLHHRLSANLRPVALSIHDQARSLFLVVPPVIAAQPYALPHETRPFWARQNPWGATETEAVRAKWPSAEAVIERSIGDATRGLQPAVLGINLNRGFPDRPIPLFADFCHLEDPGHDWFAQAIAAAIAAGAG
jgi:hypothetical protein